MILSGLGASVWMPPGLGSTGGGANPSRHTPLLSGWCMPRGRWGFPAGPSAWGPRLRRLGPAGFGAVPAAAQNTRAARLYTRAGVCRGEGGASPLGPRPGGLGSAGLGRQVVAVFLFSVLVRAGGFCCGFGGFFGLGFGT